tara:strand:+ start:325 stop:1950 length:1626 start_codon:yes stop_codon:yes gene_type:complete
MVKSYKEIFSKILYVSKISKTINKKAATFMVVFLANLSALLDILIILSIAYIFSDNISQNQLILDYLTFYNSNKLLLAFIVVLRFASLLLQKVYTKKIELIVDNDIKNHLVNEVFEKNNFSMSDSLFFVNVLSQHISFFYSSFVNFLVIMTQSLAYATYLLVINPIFLGYMILILLLLFFPIKSLFNLARKSMHESYTASKEANNFIQNIIENLFLIKLHDKGDDEINKIKKSLSERRIHLYKNEIYGSLTSVLPSFLVFLIFSIIVLSQRVLNFITIDFLGIILRLFQSISSLANTFSRIVNSYVHIEELEKIDINKQKINSMNFVNTLEDNKNMIDINEIDFKYFNNDDWTFKNLTFSIQKGLHYIVSGPNGSGKSTLLALFVGVLIPEKGTIVNRSLRTGYVGPNPLIIEGSLKENLLFGNNQKINDDKLVSLVEEINLFEDQVDVNLDMKISNKNLSSGQMQKISFLRVFASDPDLLILDESTSNLDVESKFKIIQKIKTLNNTTIINSTHEPELFDFYDMRIKLDIFEKERRIIIE